MTRKALLQTLERREARDGRHTLAVTLSVKAARDDGTIEGYASVFGVEDHYGDVIAPGAFAATIAEHKAAGTMPAMLWQHEADEPCGVWTDMVEDERGLRVVGKLAVETSRGKDAHALLKMGAINGLSIGFVSKRYEINNETQIRTLTEIDLWEASLVTFPANRQARITGVKGAVGEIASPKDAERILREAGFSKADATGLVSGLMRIGEERSESARIAARQLKHAADRLLRTLSNPRKENP